MHWTFRTLFAVLSFSGVCWAQTSIDIQPAKQLLRPDITASCQYAPIDKERAFFEKLTSDERVTGSVFSRPYRIQGKKGGFVSWFGIVRGISRSPTGWNNLTLLLEQKYFDGLTDCHIMVVSANGSGDVRAVLEADADLIPALALVRVYGRVVEERNNVPEVSVEYIRVWPWLTFTLSNLGPEDHGNPRWAKYCKLCKGGDVYNPYPTPGYYCAVLGDPKEFGLHLEDTQ